MTKFLTLFLLFTLGACQSESQRTSNSLTLKTSAGEMVKTRLVYKMSDMEQGLSGIKDNEFEKDEGMLFFYLVEDEKHFWMPDTYFNLDLIYLDKELKVLDIVRKLPHYIGRTNTDLIPRARGVWSRYVLEMRADSPISAKINIGDKLEWIYSTTLKETEEKIIKELAQSN